MIDVNTSHAENQRGAALILLVFILAIAMTAYLVKTFNSETLKVEQEQRVAKRLAEAKEAIIAWAVSNSDHLGQLPYPDRRETTTPNYDGFSDCGGDINNDQTFLFGQLPIYGQTAPCVLPQRGLGVNTMSWQGDRLWYAVSINLVHNHVTSSDPIINPEIIHSPPNPWLQVKDINGNVISNRVAAVIIAPGEALGGQNRAGVATVDNYLDTFQKGGNVYSNQDYNSVDEDFFIADDISRVGDGDLTIARPYLFNDKLVYITIDELMVALEKRVAMEVVASLNGYYEASSAIPANRYYPYAAFGGTACVDNQSYGQVPTAACSVYDGTTNTTMLGLTLPSWFDANDWEDSIFYTFSSDCSIVNLGCDTAIGKLTVGSRSNINALIISTGNALPVLGQSRPSADMSNYLDSAENINIQDVPNDLFFDAIGTPRTSTYNDQMFIVSP